MKFILCFLFSLSFLFCYSQNQNDLLVTRTYKTKDTITIDSVSINANFFELKTKNNQTIDSTYYRVNFATSTLQFLKPIEEDSVIISYQKYPDFITKTYKQFDTNIIVENSEGANKLIQLSKPNITNTFTPFDGLTTTGSISRGVTIGNNQNSVLNSELDLQISVFKS